MIRLAFLMLVTGLMALEAHAQQTTKSTSKSTTTKTKAASNGWGSDDGWGAPAPATKPAKKASAAPSTATPTNAAAATPATAPTDSARSNNSGAAAGGAGNFGGGEVIDRTPGSNEGISVAPGMPLIPSSRTRSDYMGRPIQPKPSMRPRSSDLNKPGTDLINNNPGQRP